MLSINELASSSLLATSLIILAGIGFASCTAPTVTVDELKKEIERESPVGSHYSKVIAFLDSKRILHSDYKEVKEFDLSKDDYVRRRSIGAQIPQVQRKMFATYGIYLSFYFDGDERLTEYEVVRRRNDP